jgi:hypothetical protein
MVWDESNLDLLPEYCRYQDDGCEFADTATIQLSGSYKVYLQGIAVARNIAAAEMALGQKLAVIFFDENNAKDAVVVAVYS